jgi:hypothetical protein
MFDRYKQNEISQLSYHQVKRFYASFCQWTAIVSLLKKDWC